MEALDGILVLDLSQYISAPRGTQILADMGAEVVKVEPPGGELWRLLMSIIPGCDKVLSIVNRNKKCITLNWMHGKGKEIFIELIKKADVLVENFTPGYMERFGLGWETLRKVNRKLIYASLSGFGRTGPWSSKPAFDVIGQASSGIMDALRTPDRPPTVFFADLVGGAYLAIGILLVLYWREKTGEGQFVDVSMQDVMYVHNYRALSNRALGEETIQKALDELGLTFEALADESRRTPIWNSWKARDGYVVIVALTDNQWRRFMKVIGREDLADKYPSTIERVKHGSEIIPVIAEWVAQRTVDEVVKMMDEARVPCSPVQNVERLKEDPQLKARDMLLEVTHPKYGVVKIPGVPIKLSKSLGKVRTPAPELGQHNEEIYSRLLGYNKRTLEALRKEGII